MRHRVRGRKLGRTTAHRTAMFRNQLTALFTHERITTTVAKAKELQPLAEKMVTLARTGTLANRRAVQAMVPDKEILRRLFDDVAPRFNDRSGGYTRILRLGRRRGDNAEMAIIEFVDYTPKPKGESGGDSGKPSLMDRAKGLFGGGRQDAAEETVTDTETPADAEVEAEAKADTEPEAEAEPESESESESELEPEAKADEAVEADDADAESEPEAEKKADE
jgi:large subunit ribosomal protein L17